MVVLRHGPPQSSIRVDQTRNDTETLNHDRPFGGSDERPEDPLEYKKLFKEKTMMI